MPDNRHVFIMILFALLFVFSPFGHSGAAETFAFQEAASFDFGEWGYAEGTIAQARFDRPQGMEVFDNGKLLVADTFNHCVRILDPDNLEAEVVTDLGTCTVAGETNPDHEGEPQAKSAFRLSHPSDVAVGPGYKQYYVLDSGNDRIIRVDNDEARIIDFNNGLDEDTPSPLSKALGMALDNNGDLLIADSGNHRILKWRHENGKFDILAGTGVVGYDPKTRLALESRLNAPSDLLPFPQSFAAEGLFLADTRNGLIRWLRYENQEVWLLSNYAGSDNVTVRQEQSGGGPLIHLDRPYRLAYMPAGGSGVIFLALPTQNRIVGLTLDRHAFVAAGSGAPAAASDLTRPMAIAVDKQKHLWVFDGKARLIKFDVQP